MEKTSQNILKKIEDLKMKSLMTWNTVPPRKNAVSPKKISICIVWVKTNDMKLRAKQK